MVRTISPERHDESADPILFHGKFRDVDRRVKHLEVNQALEKRGNSPWNCDD